MPKDVEEDDKVLAISAISIMSAIIASVTISLAIIKKLCTIESSVS